MPETTSARSSFRVRFLLGFLACAGLMGYALYAQYALGLDPCNLCIFQRIGMIALGVVFLVGGLVAPASARGRKAWSLLALLMAAGGGAVSARHLWIQSLPADQVPSCGAPLKDMLQMYNVWKVVLKVFCTGRSIRGLGLHCSGFDTGRVCERGGCYQP